MTKFKLKRLIKLSGLISLQLLLLSTRIRPSKASYNCHEQIIRPETPTINIDCCGFSEPLSISKIIASKQSGKKLQKIEEEYIYKSRNTADQIYKNYKNIWIRNPNGPGITSSYRITSALYGGVYSCKHETPDGKILTNNVDIKILEPPGRPVCKFPLGRILEANSSAEFSCGSVGGSPEPTYTWWFNNQKIDPLKRPDLKFRSVPSSDKNEENSESYSYLSIKSIDQRHSGTYHCTASNEVTPNNGDDNRCEPKNFELGAFSTATIIYIVGISVPSAVFIILLFICLFGCLFRRLRKRSRLDHEQTNENGESVSSTSKSSFLTTFCSCCCYEYDSGEEDFDEAAGDVILDEPGVQYGQNRTTTNLLVKSPKALPRNNSQGYLEWGENTQFTLEKELNLAIVKIHSNSPSPITTAPTKSIPPNPTNTPNNNTITSNPSTDK